MKKLIVIVSMLFSVNAFAQQQPQASPELQAIQGKLSEEYNQNLQLRAALIKEQMKVKELEAKLETKQEKAK